MQRDINVIGIDIAKRVFHVIGMESTKTLGSRRFCYLFHL